MHYFQKFEILNEQSVVKTVCEDSHCLNNLTQISPFQFQINANSSGKLIP